ncbi:MAG: hypothetical protein ACTH7X_08620 [Brevibacterium aurantiacum]
MSDDIKFTVDDEFSKSMLKTLIDIENARPRNRQKGMGPSGLGGCRERIRQQLFEGWSEPEGDEPEWNAAAVIGTLIGAHAEDAYAKAHNGGSEVSITTKLPCGISVSGSTDLILPEDNRIVDIKTKARIADASQYGPSFTYFAQIATYTLGAVQMGKLKEGASGTLCYIGRSGQDKEPWSVTLTWEQILEVIDEVDARIRLILDVQKRLLEATDDEARKGIVDEIRDCSPAYALATGCPCMIGAEWEPTEQLTDPEVVENARRYVEAKTAADDWKGAQDRLKQELRGWSGITPDGTRVVWNSRGALTVRKPKQQKSVTT